MMGKTYDQLDERLHGWIAAYTVPLYDYARERDLVDQWAGRKDEAAMAAYRAQRNSRSIGALPMAASDRRAGSG